MFDLLERHFAVAEPAATWNVSTSTIRRLFLGEPGVLNFTTPSRRKRIYRAIRIPESVARRVYARLAGANQPRAR